jgi:UDP-N-acetylglucosamine 2-epimerase (non-hydrolysing)
MNRLIKIIIVAGARPNFMKVAPLIRAIEEHNKKIGHSETVIKYLLVHTGQHYDIKMSEVFFRELNLPKPDVNLEVGSDSHAVQTANIMIRFEDVCLKERPDWILVVGDVNSTMACTLVASKLGIKVGHVEAGLRSFDRTMPEEVNRLVTDVLADLLFTPSEDADENLLNEGIPADKIKRVGNIMIDTLILNLERARGKKTHEKMGLNYKHYAYVTLHRPSNVDNLSSLSTIIDNLCRLAREIPVVFPVHPRTRSQLQNHNLWEKSINTPNLKLTEPFGYHDSIGLVDSCKFVLTDSGGLQEETTYLNIPCLTLRPNTERPVTITQGTNRLTSIETLDEDIESIMNGYRPSGKVPEFWDGRTGERVVGKLVEYRTT